MTESRRKATVHIKTIEPIAVSLPMLKPVIMAGEEVRRAENVLVRVEADNGLIGWGEAASAPVMTGDTLESLVGAVHYLTPALRGRDGADIAGALAAMDGRMYGNNGARRQLRSRCTILPAALRPSRCMHCWASGNAAACRCSP